MSKIAVIRVRGTVNIEHGVKKTLDMLRLYRKNYCNVVESNDHYRGMIEKVKDFVTYGEINEETYKLMKEKRGDGKFFRLQPPVRGFGRKGIKQPFNSGGSLGYRGEKINELIRRML